MMRTLVPAVLGLVAILGLSLYENIYIKDRWGVPGAEAAELGTRFDKVPLVIGEWEGEDLPVEEVVRKTAGAVRYVSRSYVNSETGDRVGLWLIVGHSRDITRHTPDICYPSSGFRPAGSKLSHVMETDNGKEAKFYTAKYEKEDAVSRSNERVFWAFNHPDMNKWDAPTDGARWHYGLAKALYKMYFTTSVKPDEATIEDSVALDFAEVMLPHIDAALFPEENGQPVAETTEDPVAE